MKCFDINFDTSSGNNYNGSLISKTNIGTSVINGISSPVALLGNTLVILAIIRKSSLRTPSNVLLSSLAFTDLLVGLILQPATIAIRLNDGANSSCPIRITVSLIEYLLTCVSFTNMSIISVDRYLALFYPLRCKGMITARHYVIIVVITWLSWIVLSSFRLFGLKTVFWMSLNVMWALGLTLTCYAAVRIYFLVRQKRKIAIQLNQLSRRAKDDAESSESTKPDAENTNHTKQTITAVTMGYIILLFLICYVPVGVTLIYSKSFAETVESEAAEHWAEAFFYLSSALNPLIYLRRNREIRESVKQILKPMLDICFW